MIHDCDLCGSETYAPIEVARPYIGDQEPPVVCMACGFVYVRRRRPPLEIAQAWDDVWGEHYSPEWPAVKARLYYVAEYLDRQIGLSGKSVLDIGAGNGQFLEFVRDRGGYPVGLEPCQENVTLIKAKDIACFHGTAETVEAGEYDIVTLNWTLENCGDCIGLLERARKFTRPGGHVVVATGSRLLVPFKKPLSSYFSALPQDLHCFRFSNVSLCNSLTLAGLKNKSRNPYKDQDWLVAVAKNEEGIPALKNPAWMMPDDPERVLSFFDEWAKQWP